MIEMKTMRFWRKSRFCENLANSFANGQARAIYTLAFVVFAAFSLASCSSDRNDGDWDSMVWKAEVPVVMSFFR